MKKSKLYQINDTELCMDRFFLRASENDELALTELKHPGGLRTSLTVDSKSDDIVFSIRRNGSRTEHHLSLDELEHLYIHLLSHNRGDMGVRRLFSKFTTKLLSEYEVLDKK